MSVAAEAALLVGEEGARAGLELVVARAVTLVSHGGRA
jgi:hypothetical protein